MKAHVQMMGLAILAAAGMVQAAGHPFVSAFRAEDIDETATRVIGVGLDQPRGASAIIWLK